MTSNPAIFEKAIVDSHDYGEDIRAMALGGEDPKRSTKLSANATCRRRRRVPASLRQD